MGLKIKKPNLKSVSFSKDFLDNDDDSENEEDFDMEDESSEDNTNLLSDNSDDENSDESIHSSDDETEQTVNNKLLGNPGWADAMSKILKSNKPKKKKGIVLARAKKLNDIKPKPVEEKLGFEIIKNENVAEETDEIKTEVKTEADVKEEKKDATPHMTVAQKRLLKKVWQIKGRVKPSALDKDREKALCKIATRGVITLFNTVRQQQKSLEEKLQEAGSIEVKRDKALKELDKKSFMDTLAKIAKCENVDNPVKSESEDEIMDAEQSSSNKPTNKTWNVLRNNFMMGANMKDWDKEDDENGGGSSIETNKKKPKTNERLPSSKNKSKSKFSFSMDIDADYNENDEREDVFDEDEENSSQEEEIEDDADDDTEDDGRDSSDFDD